jgi:hypothetical protein
LLTAPSTISSSGSDDCRPPAARSPDRADRNRRRDSVLRFGVRRFRRHSHRSRSPRARGRFSRRVPMRCGLHVLSRVSRGPNARFTKGHRERLEHGTSSSSRNSW